MKGLIIGSAAAYRVDPKRTDVAQRIWAGSIQAHEVAHQWFGNITTMRWWDNTYLNEGFATWVISNCKSFLTGD
jgi:aminopeptidase 2